MHSEHAASPDPSATLGLIHQVLLELREEKGMHRGHTRLRLGASQETPATMRQNNLHTTLLQSAI